MPLHDSHQDDLRSAAHDVLADHSTPERVRAIAESPSKFDSDLWKVTADLGWNALTVPEEYEGLGLSVMEACVVAEEFGIIAQATPLVSTLGASLVMSDFGSDALRSSLPLIADGTAIVSWGMLTGNARPAPGLTLSVDGDAYVLDGSIDLVPDAAVATGLLLTAGLDGVEAVVFVDARAEGLSVTPRQSLDIGRLHGTVTARGVRIGAERVLRDGSAGALFDVAVTLQCAESVGLASKLLTMAVDYLGTRVQFGQQIGRFQALKHRAADMLVQREAARVTTWEAASVLADSLVGGSEAASVAKSIAGRAASFIASEALQLHGGIGFTWEHDLHIYLRRAKVNELSLGAPSWHDERLIRLLAVKGA